MIEGQNEIETDSCYFLYEVKTNIFHVLKDRFLVGRIHGDLQFHEDKLLSRDHFEITIEDESVWIKDFETTNGVRVNGIKITKQELNHNDVILAGGQIFIFSLTEQVNDLNVQEGMNFEGVDTKLAITISEVKDGSDELVAPPKKLVKMIIESVKKPLDYKNLNRVYYYGLALATLYYLFRLFVADTLTFYPPVVRIGHDYINFLIGYYFMIAFIFFMRDFLNQKNILLEEKDKNKRIVILIIPCLIMHFIFSVISADFMQTQVIENTTAVEIDCKLRINIFKCAREIKKIFDDKELMSNSYRFNILDGYTSSVQSLLRDKYALSKSGKLEFQRIQADLSNNLEKRQKKEFVTNNIRLIKLFKTVTKPINEIYKKINCPGSLTKKLKRSEDLSETLHFYCENREGQLHGQFVVYDNQYHLLKVSNYQNDLLNGEQKDYYPNGQIKELSSFENGVINGSQTVTKWDEDGKITFQGIYRDFPQTFHQTQAVQIVKECERDVLTLPVSEYENWIERCSKNKFDNLVETIHPTDVEKIRKELIGIVMEAGDKLRRQKDILSEESQDLFKCYDDEMMERTVMENDMVQLACKDKQGKLNGPYGLFFPSKRPKIKGFYISGISSGHFKHFYENGVIAVEGNHYNNKWIGEAILRDNAGKITYQGDYSKSTINVKQVVEEKILECQKTISETKLFEPAKQKMTDCISPLIVKYMMSEHPAVTQELKEQIEYELLKFSNRISLGELKCPKDRILRKIEKSDIMHVCVAENGDVLDGPYILFYENYVPREVGLYEKNVKSGPFRQYHTDGKLKRASSYYHGEEIGISTWWNQKGEILDVPDNEEKLASRFEKVYLKLKEQCLKNEQKSICLENLINGFCEKNKKMDCFRLVEYQRYSEHRFVSER